MYACMTGSPGCILCVLSLVLEIRSCLGLGVLYIKFRFMDDRRDIFISTVDVVEFKIDFSKIDSLPTNVYVINRLRGHNVLLLKQNFIAFSMS